MLRVEVLCGFSRDLRFAQLSAIFAAGILVGGCSSDDEVDCTDLLREGRQLEVFTPFASDCSVEGRQTIAFDEFAERLDEEGCFREGACGYDDDCVEGYLTEFQDELCFEFGGGGGGGGGGGVCVSDDDCGAYLCDISRAQCFSSCTDGSECADGTQCTDSECVGSGGGLPYALVAVVSTASGGSLSATNPGPDVDAISVLQSGAEVFAAGVLSWAIGASDGGGEFGSASSVTGFPDDFAGPNQECLLDSGFTYFSFGGTGGFVAVSFSAPIEISARDQVRVYELAGGFGNCSNISTDRPDTFDVYIGVDGSAAPSTVADIESGAGWCRIGSSSSFGGVTTLSVPAACN